MGRPPTAGTLTHAQQQSLQRLYSAVADYAQNGHHVPCTRDQWQAWTSEDPDAQAFAAAHCGACPLLDRCRKHATTYEEPAGVWGGLTPSERKYAR